MAKDSRQRTTWGSRFRFLARALGLTGLVTVVAGGVLALVTCPPVDWSSWASVKTVPDALTDASKGAHGELAQGAAWALAGGLIAVAVALVVEASGLLLGATRRTAAGTSATVGTVAAVALLVVVNVYSFTHYWRFDCTRDHRFTLPAELQAELSKLRANAPTTIVVLQMHNFGTLSPNRDAYTKAAEEKVTEKVRDLVDQFREFGPQFNVVVLDSEAFGYQEQLDALTKDAPELKGAIDKAPDNSLFFHANRHVQRLSFNEFMQLDKTASKEAEGAENLVLLPQGINTFARRVLTVQERRPKVAVCVVHEFLSTAVTEGTEQYTVAGMKKALTDNGFDVVDIVLKKNWEDGTKELEPAAYTLDESKLERLEAEADSARDTVQAAKDDVRLLAQVRKELEEAQKLPIRERVDLYNTVIRAAQIREWTELLAAFRQWVARGQVVSADTEPQLKAIVFNGLAGQARRTDEQVKEAEAEQREAEAKVKAARTDERTVQDRRISDVKAKLARLVSDVDLLIVPRHTLVNVSIRTGIPPTLHTLDKKQVEVMKQFMKAGKPVLACMGSVSTRAEPAEGDDFDKLLRDRGVVLGRDTILFDAERKALASARAGGPIGSGSVTIPPLVFAEGAPAPNAAPNPISQALKHSGRMVEQKLDIKLFSPRPVYLARGWQEKLKFAGEFVFTAPAAWNEAKPFPTSDAAGRITYTPRYDPTPADDPKRNTIDEERKAAFPIGVAVEGKIPAAWVKEAYGPEEAAAAILTPLDSTFAAGLTVAADKLDRPTQRTVVFGSGHLFSGPKLEPAQERLLLHSVNWLTGREDRLPTADVAAWKYPRVELSERNKMLWRLGSLIGLPLLAAYTGLLVMMWRRTR